MRNLTGSLLLLAIGLLLFFLLLPVLGVLLLVVVGVLLLAGGAIIAAPFLAKLPWFRDRIHVERAGSFRSVRFGRGYDHGYGDGFGQQGGTGAAQPGGDDVIDVEGRELPQRPED